MQEFLPVEALGVSFKADIRRLQLSASLGSTALYAAQTSFGDMTLIVQTLSHPTHRDLLDSLHRRNALIRERELSAPLVYEQEVVKIREDSAICLTLTEPVSLSSPQELSLTESAFEGLVRCAYRAARMGMGYQGGLQRVMLAEHNGGLFMDFTRLVQEEKSQTALQEFKATLCGLMRQGRRHGMKELLFICESPFLFNLDRIALCRSWFDLAMLFNLLQHDKLTVITESRSKEMPVIKLTGVMRVLHEGVEYEPFHFRDGFRLDGITQLTLEQLRTHFFEEGRVYHMTKEKYMTVRKFPAALREYPCRIDADDFIYVRPEVSKVQFINFLIGYVRFIQPIIHQITFHAEENTLQLAFSTQRGTARRIAIRFHPKYVVKDEELAMVIEKSKMKTAAVSLRGMAIGDSFLIFLANCDKMANVRSFDISHCTKITDSALNLLLASPFCKGLAVLKINGLPLPDLQVIRSRGQLRELQLSECRGEQGEEVQVAALPITRLEALGVPIQIKFPDTLTHLAITQEVPLEQLRSLKNLPLISLQIILVETKKSIGSFLNTFNNFYSKDNPAKAFSEGSCRKTLKTLDISHSSVRLKDIRPILAIETLQSLACESMQRDKFLDVTLPHHILSLSLKRSKVNAQLLLQLTQRINFFIKLNLVHSEVSEKSLEIAIRGKKYINLLQVGEDQVGMKFFSKKSAIQGVELHLWRLLRDENEYILNALLFSQLSVCKELNLRCDPKSELRLARKVHRFLSLYQQHLRGASDLTLAINATLITKMPLRGLPPSESFTVVNLKTVPHRLKLNVRTLLAQEYHLAVTDEQVGLNLFNVALHKVLRLHPDSLLEVSLRNNRTIGAQAISLLRRYAAPRLLALDFRNCLFSFFQVQREIYEFPHLQSVNDGDYELSLSGDECCEEQLQKVLRFFMRLTLQEKMKLKLKAHGISERELYFSIMFELLHHHAGHIVELQLDFEQLPADHHAQPFWKELFLLQKLETLRIRYINQRMATEAEETNLAVQFEKMVNLNLFCLEMETTIHLIIPSHLNFKDIRRLAISYSGMEISEQVVAKLLKSTPSLHHLTLGLQNCPNISSLGKISDALQRMSALTQLSLNIQNSPIREGSLFELLQSLHKNSLLERLELNANNCLLDVNELIKVCEGLLERVRFCRILIWALQPKRPAFFRSHIDLLAAGIELVFTTPY